MSADLLMIRNQAVKTQKKHDLFFKIILKKIIRMVYRKYINSG